MTPREAAIERVRAYVEAWASAYETDVDVSGEIVFPLGHTFGHTGLRLSDLRSILALEAPVEGGVTELQTRAEKAEAHAAALAGAASEFCRKVDAGEARSTKSYAAFKEALSAYRGDD